MAEVTQMQFGLQEVGSALLKHAKISQGKWVIGMNFNINVGNLGQSDLDAKPSVMVQVQGINIARAPDDTPDNDLIIDASKI